MCFQKNDGLETHFKAEQDLVAILEEEIAELKQKQLDYLLCRLKELTKDLKEVELGRNHMRQRLLALRAHWVLRQLEAEKSTHWTHSSAEEILKKRTHFERKRAFDQKMLDRMETLAKKCWDRVMELLSRVEKIAPNLVPTLMRRISNYEYK